MKHLQILLVSFLMSGCHRIYMPNMVGGEEKVDISKLVYIENYKPVYCGDEVCKLINPNPTCITNDEANLINNQIVKNLGMTPYKNIKSIVADSHYKYTYFITYFPVDVFEILVSYEDTIAHMEIRREKNVLLLPDKYDTERWKVIKM